MILLVDNNDSFTYNLVALIGRATCEEIEVKDSKSLDIECVECYSRVIFSPGAGVPQDFPVMEQILKRYEHTKPILGICLGYQAICQYYGAQLRNLLVVAHGVGTKIKCEPDSLLFNGIDEMIVGRYHSWVAELLPAELRATAVDDKGLIMGVEHITKRVCGVQFHPESYITENGLSIINNFLYGVH